MAQAKAGGCANERKQMPRPKVGNSCNDGFVAGFNDACDSACKGEMPVKNQGLACKDKRNELPKPTTMRACTAGYGKGFAHALAEMKLAREAAAPEPEAAAAPEAAAPEPKAATPEPEPEVAPEPEAFALPLFSMNVTVDDETNVA